MRKGERRRERHKRQNVKTDRRSLVVDRDDPGPSFERVSLRRNRTQVIH